MPGGPRLEPVPRAGQGVRWTEDEDGTVEQFESAGAVDETGVEMLFDYGDRAVYEFDRNGQSRCFCDAVETHAGPVSDIVATDGTLRVTVYADDVDALRDVLRDLSDTFGEVSLDSLVRTDADGAGADVVPVDLSRLTERQSEVLDTAFETGHFDYPRDSNATAVAAELGIDPSTFSEHLAVAQRKVLQSVLDS